jgi:dienelactone hydrolase
MASRQTAHPFYFGDPARTLFGWYHAGAGATPRHAGVVLCNTLGNESLRAFGTLRHLAENLAKAGFAVLRFDFHGTGDSGGVDSDPDRVSTWVDDIGLAIEELRARSGFATIGVAGLRLGGTLAFIAAARRGDVDSLLLWDPYYSGTDFVTDVVRTHKAYVMLSPSTFSLKRPVETNDGTEALGFFMSNATIAALSAVSLHSVEAAPARRILIAGSAAGKKRTGDNLVARLRVLGAEADYHVFPEAMNRNLRAVKPKDHEAIAVDITKWFDDNLRAPDSHFAGGEQAKVAPSARREIDEEPVFFGKDGCLFGILTKQAAPLARPDRPAIIVVNAGPGTRIGPHRQYVRMARQWSKLGFLVLRSDLSGSGDSLVSAGMTESDPYPPRAVDDIRCAMDYITSRFDINRFVVAGVCSGADIAFRAGVEEQRVVGTLILNPRTFALFNIPTLEESVRVHNLAATVSARKNWGMLLRRDIPWRDKLSRISQVLRTATASLRRRSFPLARGGGSPIPIVNVPADMRRMIGRGVNTLLVVGDQDVGIMHVEIHHRKEMRALERLERFHRVGFTGIDHLFTSLYAQDLMAEAVAKHLVATYP